MSFSLFYRMRKYIFFAIADVFPSFNETKLACMYLTLITSPSNLPRALFFCAKFLCAKMHKQL